MSRRELGTSMQDLLDRYRMLPDEEQIFAERVFRNGVEVAEERARLFGPYREKDNVK